MESASCVGSGLVSDVHEWCRQSSSFLRAKVKVQQHSSIGEAAGPGWALCKVLLVDTGQRSTQKVSGNSVFCRNTRLLIAENAQLFKKVCARGPRCT